MNRDDGIELLERALASYNGGMRLDCGDDTIAHRIRAKLYHIRDGLRAEARSEPITSPAVTYTPDGKLLGVIDILRRRQTPPPPTKWDALRFRVYDGSLFILVIPEQPRRVDDINLPEPQEVDPEELSALSNWPPFAARMAG